MSRGPSTSRFSSVFDGFHAGRFFYSNLRIQETLTTIRYGVEARKGWILITGEAGVGKTTLLYKVAAELSPNVTCIVESDPRVSFTEVLQLILRSLGVEDGAVDETAMTQSCQRELRGRLQRSQLVALMFDNAHHLAEPTLRQVIKHFCGGSAEDPDGALLQLVLAGRPELKIKLSQAALLPLRRTTPILCEIQPLSSREIGPYIEHGLRSNNQAPELFDARAIKRIALYTKGNPRAVNALCEHAAQAAGGTAGASVSAELVDEVARDLNLLQSAAPSDPIPAAEDLATPREVDFTRSEFAPSEDYTEAVGRTFSDYNRDDEPRSPSQNGKRKPVWIVAMLILIMLAGAGTWVDTERARDSLNDWTRALNGVIARLQETRAGSAETETAVKPLEDIRSPEPLPPVTASGRERDQASSAGEAPTEAAIEPSTGNNGSGNATTPEPQPKVVSPPDRELRAPFQANPKQRRNQDLQLEVRKAIEMRAIRGVEVSVTRGIVYLHGRVATERQRRAAERAAHSVSDAIQVYNRILVD